MDADIPAVAERWTPETLTAVSEALAWIDGFDEQAEAALTALAEAGLLLPPGGFTREEWGTRQGGYILRESQRTRVSTHYRFATVWPVEGEPNDNWPRYAGPWVEVTPDA